MSSRRWISGWLVWVAFVVWLLTLGVLWTLAVKPSKDNRFLNIVANVTNGLIGAALGAGAAIWYAENSRARADERKLTALRAVLDREFTRNVELAKVIVGAPEVPDAVLLTIMHDELEKHVELFEVGELLHHLDTRTATWKITRAMERVAESSPASHDYDGRLQDVQWWANELMKRRHIPIPKS